MSASRTAKARTTAKARRTSRPAAWLMALAVACLPLAACSDDEAAPEATVTGRVMLGPTCPVETQASPCPPAFAAAATVEVLQDGDVVSTGLTDAAGTFTLRAPAGLSVVHAIATKGLPSEESKEVELTAGETTTVDLQLDTGIR